MPQMNARSPSGFQGILSPTSSQKVYLRGYDGEYAYGAMKARWVYQAISLQSWCAYYSQ